MSIYLDHNATTPPAPEALDAMASALRDLPGNPSSPHGPGRAARAAVERARAEVAALVGAGIPVERVAPSRRLEEAFLALIGPAELAGAGTLAGDATGTPAASGPGTGPGTATSAEAAEVAR